jgi:hypothetical protein
MTQKAKKIWKIVGIAFVVLCALSYISGRVSKKPVPAQAQPVVEIPAVPQPEKWETENNRAMAWIKVQDAIKQNLKAPATAKFPGILDLGGDLIIEQRENHNYLIKAYVDAQNDYGALIRTHFTAVIQQVSENGWRIDSLDFEE